MTPYKYIDEWLRKRDRVTGRLHTQAELASRVKVTAARMSVYRAARENPSRRVATKIADILISDGVLPRSRRFEFMWSLLTMQTPAQRLKAGRRTQKNSALASVRVADAERAVAIQ